MAEQLKDHAPEIRFVTLIGLIANLLLAAFKFAAGIYGQSQAIVADAIHSLSDSISDIAVIAGSYYWSKPADHDHPYGHRRIETLVSIFVGAMLLLAGVGIIRQAVISMQVGTLRRPGLIAPVAAFCSIIVKEFLYRWTIVVGNKVKSPALVANAWHHRSDAFSSVPALAAVGGSILFPQWVYLDGIGAVLVSLFIFHAAFKIFQIGLAELIDGSASPQVCERIKGLAEGVNGVLQIHGLRTRFTGARLHVDLHAVVDGNISVRTGHDIAEAVQGVIISSGQDVVDVVVHIEPTEELH